VGTDLRPLVGGKPKAITKKNELIAHVAQQIAATICRQLFNAASIVSPVSQVYSDTKFFLKRHDWRPAQARLVISDSRPQSITGCMTSGSPPFVLHRNSTRRSRMSSKAGGQFFTISSLDKSSFGGMMNILLPLDKGVSISGKSKITFCFLLRCGQRRLVANFGAAFGNLNSETKSGWGWLREFGITRLSTCA
jgi:hypothetical protein